MKRSGRLAFEAFWGFLAYHELKWRMPMCQIQEAVLVVEMEDVNLVH